MGDCLDRGRIDLEAVQRAASRVTAMTREQAKRDAEASTRVSVTQIPFYRYDQPQETAVAVDPSDKGVSDNVNHPKHYNDHPKGIECIDVVEDSTHPNLANAMKYIWRVTFGQKLDPIEDLRKAIWYINREISRRERQS